MKKTLTYTRRLVTSVTVALLIAYACYYLIDWAFVSAVWNGDGSTCLKATGACWAFLKAKYKLILYGIYPQKEYWRPSTVMVVIPLMFLWALFPRNWNRSTIFISFAAIVISVALMAGGFFGLAFVPTESWGGLPLTLILTALSLLIGFPLAIVLALGRDSSYITVRYFSVGLIEMVRGLPLLSLLFIVAVMLPLLLPREITADKLARATVALVLYAAAYLSEVVRGGLQGLDRGQREAAHSLGLSTWQTNYQIVIPQALLKVVPALTSTIIVAIKNTSFVLIVGLFDLLSAGRAAALDPLWPAAYSEIYLFVGAIYFVMGFTISRYSSWLELRFGR